MTMKTIQKTFFLSILLLTAIACSDIDIITPKLPAIVNLSFQQKTTNTGIISAKIIQGEEKIIDYGFIYSDENLDCSTCTIISLADELNLDYISNEVSVAPEDFFFSYHDKVYIAIISLKSYIVTENHIIYGEYFSGHFYKDFD